MLKNDFLREVIKHSLGRYRSNLFVVLYTFGQGNLSGAYAALNDAGESDLPSTFYTHV